MVPSKVKCIGRSSVTIATVKSTVKIWKHAPVR